jgi:alanine racemase
VTAAARTQIRSVVDTAALRHNLGRVRASAPDARVMSVIKANAYGHGLVPVARALASSDAFAVARLEEGLVLRDAGLVNRVLLLEGVLAPEQLAQAAQQHLDLMVHSFEQLALLEQRAGSQPVCAWIKLDTGMNRLGFRVEDFAEAYERLCRIPGVEPSPPMVTHLANADDRRDPMTTMQLRSFETATTGYAGPRSIANSAGILGWPDACADWVRPGLMLYGVSPFHGESAVDFGLRPVMTLETEVIAVKDVRPGESVGYGATWRAQRDSRIAVAAVGYGDGYPWSMASGAPVLVNGERAPLVGRVSMDMLTVDVTELPAVSPGDPVTLWGAGVPVEELARRAGTIPYELLCGVSQRVRHELR